MTATKPLGTYGNAVGTVTPLDHKMAQSGLVAKTAGNAIRPGLFWGGTANIITAKANMSYDVAAFTAALSRGATSGTVLLSNDGTLNVATTAAPGSNSRIDIIYVWAREYSLDGVDSNPVIGVVQGTAAAVPVAPSLAAFPGAIELGRATVGAGITATTSATITQTAPFTAPAGGVVPVRNTTERDAGTWLKSQHVYLIDSNTEQVYDGANWDTAAGRGLVPLAPTVSGTGVSIDPVSKLITCSGTTTLSMTGVSGYRSYLLRVRVTAKSVGAIDMAMRVMLSGTPEATSGNYRGVRVFWTGGATTTTDMVSSQTFATLEAGGLLESSFTVRVSSLNQTVPTFFESSGSEITSAAQYSHKHSFRHTPSTAYDGLQLLLSGAGTFTAEVELLGEG